MGNEKLKVAKLVLKLVAAGFVDFFAGAVITNVVTNDDSIGKIPKIGATIGGGLVAVMVGDKVGDYLCDELDDILEDIDEIKESAED